MVYNAGEFHREVFLRSGDPPCVYALRLQKLRIYGSRDGELLSDGLPPVFHTHAYRGLILQGMQTILEAVGKEGDYFQRVTERVASAMVLLVMLLSNDENALRADQGVHRAKLYTADFHSQDGRRPARKLLLYVPPL